MTKSKEDPLTVRVRVGETIKGREYPQNFRTDFEGRVVEVLSRITKALMLVPEEYRDTAYFEHDAKTYRYDDYETQFTYLYYERSETDEEVTARLQAETDRQEQLRQRELEQLHQLQEKYSK